MPLEYSKVLCNVKALCPIEGGQLPAPVVEVPGIEPALEGGFPRGPFGIEHRIPRGIAIAALHDHVLPEDSFESEAEPQRGAKARCASRTSIHSGDSRALRTPGAPSDTSP